MATLNRWSSKYVTFQDGATAWLRTDALTDTMRSRMLDAGRVETGETVVTGGKLYHAFTLPADCETCGGLGKTVQHRQSEGVNCVGTCRACGGSGREWLRDVNLDDELGQQFAEDEQALTSGAGW